ncbi:HECT-domain-containing protein [Macrolepiota fuliginosa MF-IS2]|uniref:HECT-type E3 ubiquitin transferase n=1 Tax=Macrolepiota fuliginosa MF-IS2 TaxID=1400762 RepID=A0A9P6C1I0_9AGAR|nr:HECT-domain-containing protein [Macrolepiota fuliginosa MF-IS2]
MIPFFGDEHRRRINLGGASATAGERDVLRRARQEREERRELRRRQENALKLQAWWRGISEVRRTRRDLRRTFEADPTSVTGLRCVVLMGHDEEVLGQWSCAMSGENLLGPLKGKNAESWLVLLRQASVLILDSVARYPMASCAVAHLSVLNMLLEGTEVANSVLDYLLQRNFYPLLAQAICSTPVESKSTPALAPIIQLATAPLSTFPANAPQFASALALAFQHILSIPLLPNRLPLPSISALASRLPWAQLPILRPSICDLVQSLSIVSRIHLIANIYMFASPQLPRFPSQAVGTYIKLLASLMNSLPVNALDPDAAAKKRSAQSQILQVDPDSDSEDGHGQTIITVTTVSSFSESPLPKLDSRTLKRLGSIPSANHITTLFTAASKSDTVLLDYVVLLLSLIIVWPSQRDGLLNTVAGLGSGGLIRILYRQYVIRSQLGLSNVSLNDPSNKAFWPALILLTDLYSKALLTMGDDEFFSETGATRNPLALDDLRRFSKQLLNIAVTLFWREEYTSLGQQLVTPDLKCPWETVREKITRCLVAIHARDSRKQFVPRDHWLVESEIDLQSFWLGKQSFLDDLASLDPELYNGLIFLKHYTGNPEDLSLNFTVAVDEFGVTKSIDLIPDGSETPVTKENRLTYIYLISHYRLSKQIKLQSNAFFEGLSEMIDPKWLRMFNQQEVQILLGGVNSPIMLEDLRQNTNYGGLYDDAHPTIRLFWKVVNAFTEDQKRALLRFVTSCSRPPLLGFKELVPNFSIRDAGSDELRLPTASTCVNLLKLPRYTTEKRLRDKLVQAIYSNAGFDLS